MTFKDSFNDVFKAFKHTETFESIAIFGVLLIAILGLVYAYYLKKQVSAAERGTEDMQRVAKWIEDGANAYLRRQFRIIIVVIFFLFFVLMGSAILGGYDQEIAIGRGIAFLLGSLFSYATGYYGMKMAISANVRVAAASRRSFGEALKIGYRAGTVTGMLCDGLGLFGGTIIFAIYGVDAPDVLLGFGLGGTLIALFMRVGGGIFTKAADVGADLVGKYEHDLEEDDPRNAAVIADQVGDNVGDCAGMAADIFESYEVTIVASMILGLALWHSTDEFKWVIYPLLVRAIGVVASVVGTYLVRIKPGVKRNAMRAIEHGYLVSALISILGFFMLAWGYIGQWDITDEMVWRVFVATFVGIMLAVATNRLTEYYTGSQHRPVQETMKASDGGHATNIMSGLSSGFESAAFATLLIAATIFTAAIVFSGMSITWILYGVGLGGIGQLTLTGNNVAMDSFGPIADNGQGIIQISGLDDEEAAKNMALLDATGNTTKAVTKGIAIASAVIAAVTLFGAFAETYHSKTDKKLSLDLGDPLVFVGLLIGGALPFLFSSGAIKSVARTAYTIILKVREEFARPGVMEREVDPDYGAVVEVCTSAAQRELVNLGLLAVLTPVIVGLLLEELVLGGFLAGIIISGQLLAVFSANAGGIWDNAKKLIEEGYLGGKGSEAHKAGITGDTVGDPLKDTSGPALNPMIKVVNLVSLLILPTILEIKEKYHGAWYQDTTRLTVWAICLLAIGILVFSHVRSMRSGGFDFDLKSDSEIEQEQTQNE